MVLLPAPVPAHFLPGRVGGGRDSLLSVQAHPHRPGVAGRSLTHRRTQPLGGDPREPEGPLLAEGARVPEKTAAATGMPGPEPDPPPAHTRPIGPQTRPRPVGEPGEAPPRPAPAAYAAPALRATRVLPRVATQTCVSGRVWAMAPTAPITLVQAGARRAGGTPLGARRRPEETLLKGACRDGERPPAGGRNHNTWPRCATRNAGPCRPTPSGVLLLQPLGSLQSPPGPGLSPRPCGALPSRPVQPSGCSPLFRHQREPLAADPGEPWRRKPP